MSQGETASFCSHTNDDQYKATAFLVIAHRVLDHVSRSVAESRDNRDVNWSGFNSMVGQEAAGTRPELPVTSLAALDSVSVSGINDAASATPRRFLKLGTSMMSIRRLEDAWRACLRHCIHYFWWL